MCNKILTNKITKSFMYTLETLMYWHYIVHHRRQNYNLVHNIHTLCWLHLKIMILMNIYRVSTIQKILISMMILSVDMYPMIYVEENSCTRVCTFSHWFYGWECCQKCIDTKFKLPKMVGNVEEEKSFTFFYQRGKIIY